MPEAIETISLEVKADTSEAKNGLQRLTAIVNKLSGEVEKNTRSANKNHSVYSKATKIVSALNTISKRFTKTVGSLTKALTKLVALPLKPLANAAEKVASSFKKIQKSLGRVALYRVIRAGMKAITEGAREGLENLYHWAQIVGNDFAPTMDHLASEFLYLKNSVGAALSPVIQALEPIIVNLIERIVDLLNVFNQFVSMITGRSTYRRALYYATQFGDEMEDTARAAKELKDILMDFDQLNLITTPNDRGRGNDDAENYELMFEEVNIDQSLFNMLNSADWSLLGRKLADKIATTLNGINWDRIKKKAKLFAERFATFLNGIFTENKLFTTLGETVGEGLNTVTETINTFIETTNWTALGTNLARGFKTFIDTVNSEELGKSLAAPFVAFADILHGAMEEMTPADWNRLAAEIYVVFSTAINSIPWETMIPDLVEFTTGLIKAITAAIKGIATAKDRIIQGVKNADWESFRTALWELLKSLCTDIPVIPIALTFSVLSVAFEAASKVLMSKLFASALAKAIGGTAAGSGSSVASGLLSGAGSTGGSALMAAAPYIAIAVAVAITAVVSQIKWKDAHGKQLTNQSIIDSYRKGYLTDFTFLTDAEGSGALLDTSDANISKILRNVSDYERRIESLKQIATVNPRQLGFDSVEEALANLDLAVEGLGSTNRDEIARAGYYIDTLWSKYGVFTDDVSKKGTSTMFGLISDAQNAGQKITDTTKTTSGTINGTINKVDQKWGSLANNGAKYGNTFSVGFNNGIYKIEQPSKTVAADVNKAFSDFSSKGTQYGSKFATDFTNSLKQIARQSFSWDVKTSTVTGQSQYPSIKATPSATLYANGGYPDMGSMFIAGESGAEMVGTINGRTGVASGEEITGIADAVYGTGATEASLLRTLIGVVESKNLSISPSASLGKVVNQSQRLYQGVTG